METTLRTIVKAISWQLVGFIMMILISYYYMGSMSAATSLASISVISGILFFIVHEKVWQHIQWGRQ